MSAEDPKSSGQKEIAAEGDEDVSGNAQGKNDGNGIPKWLGWLIVLAILFMMAAALVLGLQQLEKGGVTEPPTPTPLPAIGSIEVEPQTEMTGTVDSPVSAEAGTGEAEGEAASESVAPSEGAAQTTGAEEQDNTTAISEAVEEAPTGAPVSGAELLTTEVISGATIIAPVAIVLPNVPIVPTATDVPATGGEPTEQSPIATAFGRVRVTQLATATSPAPTTTSTIAPTATPIPTMTPTVTPTATPVPTVTSTYTPTPALTAEPTADNNDNMEGSGSIVPGRTVVARVSVVVLRMDASEASPAMETYESGSPFEVLEPGGSAESYPVEVDGGKWIRVRAEDGLVGWVLVDQVETED